MGKLLSNKFSFFAYCIVVYILLVIIVGMVTSPIFTMHISESLACVLLAYWISKMVTRFIAVRSYFTPAIFLVVQVVAMISGIAFSHENSGASFTMWTCGAALILFIVTQVVLKKIMLKNTAVS